MGSLRFVCIASLLLGTTGCATEVARGLEEAEANRIVVALNDNQVAASKQPDPTTEARFLVEVAQADLGRALSTLSAAGLPAQRSPGMLEALGESGLVASPENEHARQVVGTAGELERSLSGLEGVLSARVHLGIPEPSPFSGEMQRAVASASVLLRHRGVTPPLAEREVARLVAGAVPGLAPDAVVVVFHPVPTTQDGGSLAAFGPLTVGRNSLPVLRWVLGGAALLNVFLVMAVSLMWLRLRGTARPSQRGAPGAS